MTRVGVYTGRVYSQDDYDKGNIKECAVVASPTDGEQALDKAKEFALLKRIQCPACLGCEAAKNTELAIKTCSIVRGEDASYNFFDQK